MNNKTLKHEKRRCLCDICQKHYDKTKKQIKRIAKRKNKEVVKKELEDESK